jgi:hypothetical protein
MARAKRIREPGEPEVGSIVPWMRRGQGQVTVLRVTRRGGRWTSVTVGWVAGCCVGPDYEGQPREEWDVPRGSMRICREEWEEISRMEGTWREG